MATNGTELACSQVIHLEVGLGNQGRSDEIRGALGALLPNLCAGREGTAPELAAPEVLLASGFSDITTARGAELSCAREARLKISARLDGRWRRREISDRTHMLFPTLCGADEPRAEASVATTRGDTLSCYEFMRARVRLPDTAGDQDRGLELEDEVRRFLPLLCAEVVATPQCSDGRDNDLDGYVDLMDLGCESASDDDETDPAPVFQCSDGIDNDGDGEIDLADDGCDSASDDDETDPAPVFQCSDGIDNDGDGEIDLADDGCDSASDDDETDPAPVFQCSDGIDNDGDGEIDLADDGCESASDDDETDPAPLTLSEQYPGDVGLAADPAVVWFEDFEASSVAAVVARYDQARDNGRMSLVSDTPNRSGTALAMDAGDGVPAVDLFKRLPNSDEWYVRWYVKHDQGGARHHSGLWIGGYNPATTWPFPRAGQVPACDSHFSVAMESYGATMDYYNYWCNMRGNWGNQLIERSSFRTDEGSWMCLEMRVKLNTDLQSQAGAVLQTWKNDFLIQTIDEDTRGYWSGDSFCTADADQPACTSFPDTLDDPADLQFRDTGSLALNHIWPQNYVSAGRGTLTFDQLVVATERVGCMTPP